MCPDLQDWFDRVTLPGIGDGLVDIGEWVELHESVEGELSRPVMLDQLGDEALGHGVALDDADGLASAAEGAGFHTTGEEHHAPLGLQGGDGQANQLRVAGRIHHEIDTASGDLDNAGDDLLTVGVDDVGGPQLQGELEAPGDDVHADDRPGADDPRRHDRCQAHSSCTEDGDAGAGRDGKRIHYAPAPVCRPQPRGARSSSGSSWGTMTILRLVARQWVANDDCPKKCPRTPLRQSALLPSRRAKPKFAS